jgi:dCTP deaminase
MILPDFMIRGLIGADQRHVVDPYSPRQSQNGLSWGESHAGYDVRIKQAITLEPGGFSLGSTIERFSMPADVIGLVKDKSTWARRGLSVFNTVIECSWNGWLTVELKNQGNEILRISEGDPIAQIIFHRMEAPPHQGYGSKKYQNQPNKPVPAILEPAILEKA